MTRVGIFLIAAALLASLVSMVGCVLHHPAEIWTEIWNWYDLNATRDNLGGSYLLMGDLDSGTPGYEELASETANQGKGWQPIGTWNATFTGTLDGQGYEIRDFFIDRPDEDYVGLFWRVGQSGVIRGIGMVYAVVAGHNFAGAFVGWNEGTVLGSYFRGSMTGDVFVGGLVGWNGGTVSSSYSDASVIGNRIVGGLVGSNEGTVRNSWSAGTVTGSISVGGLVGRNKYGAVGSSYSDATVTGHGNVGGLVGSLVGIGSIYLAVHDSYCTGSVTGDEYVGGLVGYTFDGTVSDCYSTAIVSGNLSAGGLVGENEISTVSNSFWDTETSGQATSDGGRGETTAGMKSIGTFSGAGWSIIAVGGPSMHNSSYLWNIVENVTYPALTWFLLCPQGPPAQMTTRTTPSGYLELTVSPAEVCAYRGEQIEIRCSIYCLINTIVEISSVDVLLFDRYGSKVRERAMTKDSYWSAHTVYTIMGDEAYYKIKVNFAVPGDGRYSEYGAYSFPIVFKT